MLITDASSGAVGRFGAGRCRCFLRRLSSMRHYTATAAAAGARGTMGPRSRLRLGRNPTVMSRNLA